MANISTNVSTGKPKISGGVWVAPSGTTLPTDATTDLGGSFTCLGYVSEDGVENSNDMGVSETKAWGGSIVLRSLDSFADNFSLALIESKNVDVLKNVYGDSNVSIDADNNITVNVVAENPQEKVWVFEVALRGGKKKRIVIPVGAVTAREAITYNDSDAIAYGITVSAYPDSNGKTHTEYIEGEAPSV